MVHNKSKILHKAKVGDEFTLCKTKVSANFRELERTFHFKYPKCMRCFVKDGNRLKSSDDMAKHLDEMSKRRKLRS